jgi:hypothetical protein
MTLYYCKGLIIISGLPQSLKEIKDFTCTSRGEWDLDLISRDSSNWGKMLSMPWNILVGRASGITRISGIRSHHQNNLGWRTCNMKSLSIYSMRPICCSTIWFHQLEYPPELLSHPRTQHRMVSCDTQNRDTAPHPNKPYILNTNRIKTVSTQAIHSDLTHQWCTNVNVASFIIPPINPTSTIATPAIQCASHQFHLDNQKRQVADVITTRGCPGIPNNAGRSQSER